MKNVIYILLIIALLGLKINILGKEDDAAEQSQTLQKAVEVSIHNVITGDGSIGYWGIIEKYGPQKFFDEYAKQVKSLTESDYVMAVSTIMEYCSTSREWAYASLQEMAIKNISSRHPSLANSSIAWCVHHRKILSKEENAEVARLARAAFEEQEGEGYSFYNMQSLAQKEDVELIRKVYLRRMNQIKNEAQRLRAFNNYSCVHKSRNEEICSMLLKMEDPFAIKEIQNAILQSEDVQKRIWAIRLAAINKTTSLISTIYTVLQDKRFSKEPISREPYPQDEGHYYTHYTRACDVALRALCSIMMENPEKKFSYKIHPLTEWELLDYKRGDFQYAKKLRMESNSDSTLNDIVVVGFSDDQIESVREYIKKMGLDPISQMKSGKVK